jgi:RpiR family carbohydrate utilization transcriptional regulator
MIISQIDSHLAELRPSEQRVARFVLGRPTVVVEMSIADLAERADVSEPTIMRFCKAIGCMGFMDFKLSLARDQERRTLSMSRQNPHVKGPSGLGQALFEQVTKTLGQKGSGLALDEIDTLLEICAGSGRIIVLHSGAETLFADTLVSALRGCGLETCDQTTADISGRRDSVLVIALKSSLRIPEVEQSLQDICAQGGRVALIGHAGLPATISLGQFDAGLSDYIAYAAVIEAIRLGIEARLSKSGHFSQADSEMLQSRRENAYADARRRDRPG